MSQEQQMGHGRRRLNAADEELAAYFTESVGVRAQSYEIFGTGSPDPHAARIAALGRVQVYDAVARTIEHLPLAARKTIVLVYGAGAGVLEEGAERGINDIDLRLVQALQPKTGFGSFVWLASTLDRAREAYERHLRKSGTSLSVLTYLKWEATVNPKESTALFAVLKAECVRMKRSALDAYEPLRAARVEAEHEARKVERGVREAARERYLDEELEIDAKLRSLRFERKMRRLRGTRRAA